MFRNIVSSAIENQLPQFIRDDAPLLTAFLEAYYEWCEQQDGAIGSIASYRELMDASLTTDEYFRHFKAQFMPTLPADFVVDRGLLVKNVKDFYAAKGTMKSLKFLFRILFNEDIEIYLPKVDILRASDGKWQRDIRIFVKQVTGDPVNMERRTVMGQTSGARGAVSRVTLTQEGTLPVYTMQLDTYEGTFTVGETITDTETNTIFCLVHGAVESVDVLNGGDGYAVGQLVDFYDIEGFNAIATVSKIDGTNPILNFDIVDGGHGYQVGDIVDFSRYGQEGVGAIAIVSQIDVEESKNIPITLVGEIQNTVIDTIDHLTIAQLCTFADIELGSITDINLIEAGSFYPLRFPIDVIQKTPTYGEDSGTGAEIYANAKNIGRVLEVAVDKQGVGYSNQVVASLANKGNGLAKLHANITGGPFIRSGYYLNDDGKLNSSKVLQDNVFYQNYSYVIRTNRQYREYAEAVLKNVHPAGMAMFGELILEGVVANPSGVVDPNYEITIASRVSNIDTMTPYYNIDYTNAHEFSGYTYEFPIISDYAAAQITTQQNTSLADFFGINSNTKYNQPFGELNVILSTLTNPKSLPDLKAWWDFSDTTTWTYSGNNLSALADKSGNGRTQSTGANYPQVLTRTKNGLNVGDFTGTQGLLGIIGSAVTGGPTTTFIVNSFDTLTGTQTPIAGLNGTSLVYGMQKVGSTLNAIHGSGVVSTPVDTNYHINGFRRSGTNMLGYMDGVTYSGAGATNVSTVNGVRLGRSASGQYLDGAIAEVLIYGRALSNAEINLVGGYLSNKWAVSWTPIV